MTDTQTLPRSITLPIPLGFTVLMHGHSRITGARQTLRSELEKHVFLKD